MFTLQEKQEEKGYVYMYKILNEPIGLQSIWRFPYAQDQREITLGIIQ